MATETRQPVEGTVVSSPPSGGGNFVHPQAGNPNYLPIFPELSTVVSVVDRHARRIPWWFWVGGTLAAVWYLGKKKGRGKVIHLDE